MSLAAPQARARFSFMVMAGAVVVASALSQAIANPMFARDVQLTAAPPIQAPLPTVTPVTALANEAGGPAASMRLTFNAPTPGYPINSPFGLRRLPWEPRGRMHEGVDIAAPKGLAVRATLAGTVIRAGQSPTYGRFVEVRHAEGLTSLYAHMGSVRRGLKAGDDLAAGEPLGVVGNTGRSTGEHLHFEIRSDGRPLNPALFIGKTFADADALPLDAAARFSRRVRLAVVSPQALARMMPQTARKTETTPIQTRDGRVRGILPVGDPSPQAMKAATEAHGSPATPPTAASVPSSDAPPATAPSLSDFSAMRLDTLG